MTLKYEAEIRAHLERAEESLAAAGELTVHGYCDFAASRAYYAAFYAATALLLAEELTFSKHSGVIAHIHQRVTTQPPGRCALKCTVGSKKPLKRVAYRHVTECVSTHFRCQPLISISGLADAWVVTFQEVRHQI